MQYCRPPAQQQLLPAESPCASALYKQRQRKRTSLRCQVLKQPHELATKPSQQAALLYDFHDQLVPYEQAWQWQKQRVTELCSASETDSRDTVFILQHPPVYTLGAGSSEGHVKFDLQQPPHPLYRTERGGEVTYHGPGQLVVYPILDLTRHTQDLHWYLRGLEEVVIRALAATSGLSGQRVEGLTGVWVQGHKLAAIGVRARKWVTYHGLALNVSTDLQPFQLITPCGIADKPVGSVRTALQQQQQQDAALAGDRCSSPTSLGSSRSSSCSSLGISSRGSAVQEQPPLTDDAIIKDPLITEYRYALLESLEDVFGLKLQPASALQVQQLQQQ